MRDHQQHDRAKAAAAEYLRRKGFTIVLQDWKTRRCRIDIIAKKGRLLFFTHVKLQPNVPTKITQEVTIEPIPINKLDLMYFAAEQWVDDQGWRGDYRMAAILVDMQEFTVSSFVDDLF